MRKTWLVLLCGGLLLMALAVPAFAGAGAGESGESGAGESGESGASESGESGASESGESGASESGESGAGGGDGGNAGESNGSDGESPGVGDGAADGLSPAGKEQPQTQTREMVRSSYDLNVDAVRTQAHVAEQAPEDSVEEPPTEPTE